MWLAISLGFLKASARSGALAALLVRLVLAGKGCMHWTASIRLTKLA